MSYARASLYVESSLTDCIGSSNRTADPSIAVMVTKEVRPSKRQLSTSARLLDLVISGLCLIALSPAIFAVWVAIRRSSPHMIVTGPKSTAPLSSPPVELKAARQLRLPVPFQETNSAPKPIVTQA